MTSNAISSIKQKRLEAIVTGFLSSIALPLSARIIWPPIRSRLNNKYRRTSLVFPPKVVSKQREGNFIHLLLNPRSPSMLHTSSSLVLLTTCLPLLLHSRSPSVLPACIRCAWLYCLPLLRHSRSHCYCCLLTVTIKRSAYIKTNFVGGKI